MRLFFKEDLFVLENYSITNHCCPVKKLYFMNHLVFIGSIMNLTNHLVFRFSRKVTKSQKIKPINIGRLSIFARLSKHNLREIIFYRTLMIINITLWEFNTFLIIFFSGFIALNLKGLNLIYLLVSKSTVNLL